MDCVYRPGTWIAIALPEYFMAVGVADWHFILSARTGRHLAR